MAGFAYDETLMNSLCERIHNGEYKVRIQEETGVNTTTLVKYYRKWCSANGFEERRTLKNATTYNLPTPKASLTTPAKALPTNNVVLAIPDLHCPFQHPDALNFLKEVRSTKHTTLSICLGDEIDAASFSRYTPDPDGLTPGQELSKSIEALQPFYLEFPDMLVCESNHTVRPFKKAFEAGLPASFLPSYATLLNAPDGWRWAGRWIVDNVLYIHGDNGKSGAYAHINYMKSAKQSVVIGHVHSYAGVNYEANHFGMNTGCLIDETAYCFKYAKNMLIKVNLGCGIIYEGKYAEFIPMRVDSHNRWIGKL